MKALFYYIFMAIVPVLFAVNVAMAQPANDNCANATVLTVGASCVTTSGTTVNATESIPAISCAGFTALAALDVWYQFVATAANLSVTVVGDANFDAVIDVRSGACNGTNIACADATLSGGTEVAALTGLTIGTTYLVRVYDFSGTATFTICVTSPASAPANDDCAGAIAFPTIPNDGTCANVTVTTVGATGAADPVCTGTEDDDVWFTFTTPAGVTSLLYTNTNISGNTDRVLQIYSGTCAGLTSIGCYDPESGTITGLTGSTTYRLRAYTWSAGVTTTFNLCLRTTPPPPANDNCAGAIAFPTIPNDGTCANVTVTTEGATGAADPVCTGAEDDDVWFTFTTPAGVTSLLYTNTNISGNTDRVLQIYSGTCAGLTSIGCYDPESGTITGLTGSTTYRLRAYTFGTGVTTTFNLCLRTPPPPPTCPGALGTGTVNIASLPYNGTGLTNCGNGNNITSANATVCGSTSYYGGEDRTFIFTPTASGVYDIILTTASTWTGLMLYAGCPFSGTGGTCVAQSQSSTGNKTLNVNLTAGTTYYLVVDAFPAPNCHPSFDLSIASAIPPCTAPGTPMASNVSSTSATVSWAAAPGALTYDWTVGTGASCPTGTGANTAATSINLSGLVPNTTYRVCVRTSTCGGGAASGYVTTTFTTEPLPNDLCAGAQTVTCGSTVNGSTVGATSDASVGSCGIGTGGTPGNGVWYKLVGNGAQVTASLCASAYDTKIHVYTGSCAGLTCLVSNDDNAAACGAGSTRSQVVFNANVGTDYFILVSGFSTNTGAFSLNLSCLCGPVLGAPWTTTTVGGGTGGAIENVCDNSIDLSSNGFSSSLATDLLYFAHQNLCGNQSVTVRVKNVTNAGFAGIMFRESTAAGSKLVAIKTQLNNFVHREVRATTNGIKSAQQTSAFGHSWLRLVRNGNTFTGFHSDNGVNWQQAFVITVAMNNCLEVGLFVQGINVNSTATASFSDISGLPLAPPIIPLVGGNNLPLDVAPLDYTLFPNPAQSEINIKMGEEFIGKEVTIRISNQLGQTVMTRRIGEVQNLVENIQLNNLTEGIYIMTLQTEGRESLTKKFVMGLNRP